jgi:hypothetical protein
VTRITAIARRIGLGALPVVALVIFAPRTPAHAQFSIFEGLISTVTGMGSSINQFNTDRADIQKLQQAVVYPTQELNAIQANGNSIVNSYRSWTQGVLELNVASAQTISGQALEQRLLSGFTSTTPTSQMGTLFVSSYGTLPATSQAPAAVTQTVDLGDATSRAAMQMSVMADSAAASSVQVANSIESQALVTSPGSGPHMEAEALASELSSMAIEHKLLAAQLRAEAARLAYNGGQFKQGATITSNATQGIFGGTR